MAEIAEYYERYWDNPEAYYDPTTPERTALLARHVGEVLARPGARVIDVGCGRGEFCAFFKSKGAHAEGIDLSETGIRYARKHHPGITFHAGLVESLLPARRGEFDLVFTSEVIEHLFDPASFLAACNQLLKPGGTLVVTTPYHGLIKNILIDVANYAGHYDPLGQHIRFYDRKGLSQVLEVAGFRGRVWTGYGRPWPLWKSFFVVADKAKDVTVEQASAALIARGSRPA